MRRTLLTYMWIYIYIYMKISMVHPLVTCDRHLCRPFFSARRDPYDQSTPSHSLLPLNWQLAQAQIWCSFKCYSPLVCNLIKWCLLKLLNLRAMDQRGKDDLMELNFCTHVGLTKFFQSPPSPWNGMAPISGLLTLNGFSLNLLFLFYG